MADPVDIDPNAPAKWSWVPDSWRDADLAGVIQPPVMQPGMGIPQQTIDAAAASPRQAPADVSVGYVDDGKFVPARDVSYTTRLAPKDEREFQKWVKDEKVPFDSSPKADYDMRGFWLAKKSGDPRAASETNKSDGETHYPDTWKTPFHKTFSDESIYSTPEAASWQDDKLTDHSGRVIADESIPPPMAGGPVQPGLGIPTATMDDVAHAGGVLPFGPQPMPSATGPQSPVLPPGAPPDVNVGTIDDGRFVPAVPPQPPVFGPHGPGVPDLVAPVTTEAAPSSAPAPMTDTGVPSIDERGPDSEISKYTAAELLDMAHKDPARLAGLLADRESDMNVHFARRKQQIEDAAEAQRQRDLQSLQEAKALTDATMREISDRIDHMAKVDPNRLLNSRSAGTRLADFIGLIAGGFAAGQGGGNGVNQYMVEMNKAIDRDIDAQKTNIENDRQNLNTKKSMVAEEYARTGNLYQATETVRAATLQAAKGRLLDEIQLYDPASAKNVHRVQAVQAVEAAMQQHAAATAQQFFKNHLDERKQANEESKTQVDWGKLALDVAKFNEKPVKGSGGAGAAKEMPSYGTVYPTLNDVPEKFRKFAIRLPVKNGVPGGYILGNNEKTQEDATHLIGLYNQADYDANELQKISLRRKGAMSTAGGFNKDWKDTDEQHYEALLVDLANTYGMLIHGRAPTAGVLEEVMTKSAPELKPFWKSGDTTALINHFRNDVDNRTTLRLQDYGSNERVTSDRPKIEEPNANTIKAPLVAKPVKGAAGFAPFSVAEVDQRLKHLFQDHVHHRTTQKDYRSDLDDVENAQHAAIVDIGKDIATLSAKRKRSPAEQQQLNNATQAMADRNEAIKAIETARKLSIQHELNQNALEETNKRGPLKPHRGRI